MTYHGFLFPSIQLHGSPCYVKNAESVTIESFQWRCYAEPASGITFICPAKKNIFIALWTCRLSFEVSRHQTLRASSIARVFFVNPVVHVGFHSLTISFPSLSNYLLVRGLTIRVIQIFGTTSKCFRGIDLNQPFITALRLVYPELVQDSLSQTCTKKKTLEWALH